MADKSLYDVCEQLRSNGDKNAMLLTTLNASVLKLNNMMGSFLDMMAQQRLDMLEAMREQGSGTDAAKDGGDPAKAGKSNVAAILAGLAAFATGFAQGFIDSLNKLKKLLRLDDVIMAIKNIFTGEGRIAQFLRQLRGRLVTLIDDGMKLVDAGVDSVKAVFGPEGRIGKFFANLKGRFFSIADDGIKVVDDGLQPIKNLFSAEGRIMKLFNAIADPFKFPFEGFIDNVAKPFKDVFGAEGSGLLQRIFDTLMRPFRAASEVIEAIISPIRNFFSAEGPIAKAFDVIKQAFSMFSEGSQFMKMLSGIGRVIGRLFYPLTLIMTVWDVVKGAIAGYEDEGFVGAIQGGITGLVNGVIGMPLDLLKSVVSWILGKFGFENAEKALDSFSFEDLISRAIDGIFDMFKMVINGFLEAVATLVDAIPIPGTSKAAEAIRGMKFDTNVQERKRLDSQIESAKNVAMNDEKQLKNAEQAYKRAKRADVITVNGRKLTGAEKDAYVENKYGKRYTDALEKSAASDEKVAQLEMDRAALDGNKGSGTNVVDASQTNNVSSSSSQPVVGGAPTAWDASDPMMQDAAA